MRYLIFLFLLVSCGEKQFSDEQVYYCGAYLDQHKTQMNHDLQTIRAEYDSRIRLCEHNFDSYKLLNENLGELSQAQLKELQAEVDRLTQENVDLKLKMRKLNQKVKR